MFIFKIFLTYLILTKHFKVQSQVWESSKTRYDTVKRTGGTSRFMSPKERPNPFHSKWGNILRNIRQKHPCFLSFYQYDINTVIWSKQENAGFSIFSVSLSLSLLPTPQHSFSPSPAPSSFPLLLSVSSFENSASVQLARLLSTHFTFHHVDSSLWKIKTWQTLGTTFPCLESQHHKKQIQHIFHTTGEVHV